MTTTHAARPVLNVTVGAGRAVHRAAGDSNGYTLCGAEGRTPGSSRLRAVLDLDVTCKRCAAILASTRDEVDEQPSADQLTEQIVEQEAAIERLAAEYPTERHARRRASLRQQLADGRANLSRLVTALGSARQQEAAATVVDAEEQREADADTATGTDADRVTISARASEVRPGDLVVDSLGNRQYAAFDVQAAGSSAPHVKVWTAVADQERGLPPVLILNAGRELLVSRRLTPEQQVEARELFGS